MIDSLRGLIVIATAQALVLLLCGCDDPLKTHKMISDRFKTSEVQQINGSSFYIVRDTNGAIWEVMDNGYQHTDVKIFDAR